MKTPKVVARLEQRVRDSLAESGLTGGKTLVVAVSGGPDSLALLFALHRLSEELSVDLHGAHLDHGIRGEASAADARFVADIFSRLGVGLTNELADVPSHQAEHGQSLEEAAREVRYSFLARVAATQHADAVAVGHTRDDQVETVMLNIIRGSGLAGLRGMAQTSARSVEGHQLVVVRPLLDTPRIDTEEYCHALGLSPRIDESNASTELTRNRVRMEVLPVLERQNPAARDSLLRLSRAAKEQVDFLEDQVAAVWDAVVRIRPDHAALDRDAFARQAPAMQSQLLRQAVSRVAGGLKEVEESHLGDMRRLMGGQVGRTLDLPRGIVFTVGYDEATIGPAGLDLCPLPPLKGVHQIEVPSDTVLPGWRMRAAVVETGVKPSPMGDGLTARFGLEQMKGRMCVRARRPGDRFQPLGMDGSKKLQDYMVDSKIPESWRDRVPLLACDQGIAWVVGWRIAQWARVRDGDTNALELRFVPQDPT